MSGTLARKGVAVFLVLSSACSTDTTTATSGSDTTTQTTSTPTAVTSTTSPGTSTTQAATTTSRETGESNILPGVDRPQTFCEAVALAPVRWIEGAFLDLQIWRDSFADISDVPDEATEPLQHLLDFADRRMRWHLGFEEDRPTRDDELTQAALVVLDTALDLCAGFLSSSVCPARLILRWTGGISTLE